MDATAIQKPSTNLNVAHRFVVDIQGNGTTTYVNLKDLLKEKRLKELGDKKEQTEKEKVTLVVLSS